MGVRCVSSNGISRNGISRNGVSRNGVSRNGVSRNGVSSSPAVSTGRYALCQPAQAARDVPSAGVQAHVAWRANGVIAGLDIKVTVRVVLIFNTKSLMSFNFP